MAGSELEKLSRSECLEALGAHHFRRVAVGTADGALVVEPVN